MGPERVDTKTLSSSELRKVNKPLMEKKRRARINESLNELKSLVLDALKRDTSRYSKLEKADILEMTVKHLRSVQRQQMTAAMVRDSSVAGKYQSGFAECATEVSRYLSTIDGLPSEVRCRLLDHLRGCVHKVSGAAAAAYQQYPAVTYPTATPLASMPGSMAEVPFGGAFQLMPTALPNGQVVLIPQTVGATSPLYIKAQDGDRRHSLNSPESRDRYGSVSSPESRDRYGSVSSPEPRDRYGSVSSPEPRDRYGSVSSPEPRDRYGSVSSTESDDSHSVNMSSPESERWGSPPLREPLRGQSPSILQSHPVLSSVPPHMPSCHNSPVRDLNFNLVKPEPPQVPVPPQCEQKPSPVLRQRSQNIHLVQEVVKHHVVKQEPIPAGPKPEVRFNFLPIVCENMWRPW